MAKMRPIPKDMRSWVNELLGIHKYLARIEIYAPSEGEAWISKQQRYYHAREKALLENPPNIPTKWRWLKMLEAY